MEDQFWNSVYYGRSVTEVKEILKGHPGVNVNWQNSKFIEWTALHRACSSGSDSIVSLLLAHPDIDVNLKTKDGKTGFWLACSDGSASSVRLLLRDARVDVSLSDARGLTPLQRCVSQGYVDSIKWWIVSGRTLDLNDPAFLASEGNSGVRKEKAAKSSEMRKGGGGPGAGDNKGKSEAMTLLHKFRENPEKSREEIRKELGIAGEFNSPAIKNLLDSMLLLLPSDPHHFFFFFFFFFFQLNIGRKVKSVNDFLMLLACDIGRFLGEYPTKAH